MSSIVVLGAGINGLVAANVLSQAGHTVTVTDPATGIGGAARSDEITAGYIAPGILDRTERFSTTVVEALGLGELPRGSGASVLAVDREGAGILCPDGRGADSSELGAQDRTAWQSYFETHANLSRVLTPLMESVPPSPLGQNSIGLGWLWTLAKGYRSLSTMERELLLRVPPAPLADWLDENFHSPELKASLAWAGLEGAFAAPASPGTAAIRMFHDVSDAGPVVGGTRKLVEWLESGCRSRGVTIRTGVPHRILVSQGQVQCVDLGGDRQKASAVLSTLDPVTTLLSSLEGAQLAPALQRSLRKFAAEVQPYDSILRWIKNFAYPMVDVLLVFVSRVR